MLNDHVEQCFIYILSADFGGIVGTRMLRVFEAFEKVA